MKEGYECYYCPDIATKTIKWAGETYRVCQVHLAVLESYTGLDLEVANE